MASIVIFFTRVVRVVVEMNLFKYFYFVLDYLGTANGELQLVSVNIELVLLKYRVK